MPTILEGRSYARLRFTEIKNALGPTIIIDAHKLGSSTLTKTTLWTNAPHNDFLAHHYANNHRLGDKVPLFLTKHGFTNRQPTVYTGDYFPKFMARAGIYMYNFIADGKPGPGLLLHQGTLHEPSLEMKELAMGYTVGTTAA